MDYEWKGFIYRAHASWMLEFPKTLRGRYGSNLPFYNLDYMKRKFMVMPIKYIARLIFWVYHHMTMTKSRLYMDKDDDCFKAVENSSVNSSANHLK